MKLRTEELEIRFQEPNIPAHHAKMGNPLSLYPKIHRLGADAKEAGSIPDGQRQVRLRRVDYFAIGRRSELGVVGHGRFSKRLL
jgi:hypothetical protein